MASFISFIAPRRDEILARVAIRERELRAQIERVRRMTIEERIKAALSMGQRFSWLQPVTGKGPDHE